MNGKLSSRFKKIKTSDKIEKKILKFQSNPSSTKVFGKSENNAYSLKNISDEFIFALLKKVNTTPVWFDYSKEKQQELVKNFIDNKLTSDDIKITEIDRDILTDTLISNVSELGAIQYLLNKCNVSSVIVSGTNSVFIEISGRILNTETSLTKEQLEFLLNTIMNKVGVNDFAGIGSYKTEDYYITVIDDKLCENGLNITIKKVENLGSKELITKGMFTEDIYNYLKGIILDRKNIIISGGINSGKTTLINALIEDILLEKRVYILENSSQVSANSPTLVKFNIPQDEQEYSDLISYVQKTASEYIITDTNRILEELLCLDAKIVTLRASSAEFAIKDLISLYIKSGLPEKYAKIKAYSDFDYIIQLEKSSDGSIKLESISELSPSKTMASSIKTVVKLIDGKYFSDIPQPLTNMKAKSASSKGQVSSRFSK